MFAWMTIMSFDMCWTFTRAKVPKRDSALLKFLIYSGAAWGFSAVLTIPVILIDQVMEDQAEDQKTILPKPNVGKTKCFLEDKTQGVYLHFPILILMMINGMFFVITTCTLYKSHLTTQQARYARQISQQVVNTSSRINQETKEQLVLYIKLFTVMGILWIFESVHYLVHGDHRNMECVFYTEFVLRIIGCVNLLRGCLIFFIFVCKNSIKEKVSKLSVCGIRLSFLTVVTTEYVQHGQGAPLVHLQDNQLH